MVRSVETVGGRLDVSGPVLFAAFIYTSGSSFLSTGLGPAGRSIGLSEIEVGAILSLGALAAVLASPAWGYASEHWSRRRLVLLGAVMVALAPAAMAAGFAASAALPTVMVLAILLAARLVQTAFGAALLPLAQAYVAQLTAPSRRLRGMGIMSIVLSLGTVGGSALLWVVAHLGVVTGFLGIAGLGLVALLVALLLLPEIEPPEVAAPQERQVPMRRIWPNIAITVVGYVAYTMVQPLVGLRFIDRYQLDNAAALGQAGLALAGASLGIIVSQAIVSAGTGLAPVTLLRLGSLGALASASLTVLAPDVWWCSLGLVAIGLSLGLMVPSNLVMISLATGSGAQGKVGGINTAARGLGLALGPITGTVLYRVSPELAFGSAGALLGFIFVLSLWAGSTGNPADTPRKTAA